LPICSRALGKATQYQPGKGVIWRGGAGAFLLQQLSSFYAATIRKGALARYPIVTENVYVSTI
jgi:hypothetical protein